MSEEVIPEDDRFCKKFLDEALKRIKSLEQTSTKSFEEFKAVLADASAEVAEKVNEVMVLDRHIVECFAGCGENC